MKFWLFFASLSFVWAAPDTNAHLLIQDSSGQRWAAARVFLAESVQTTDLGPTHIQSSTWARLQAYGELSSQWSWHSTTTVYTDISNRNYPANFYEPNRGIPYNTQDSGRRTWDYTTARSDFQFRKDSRLFAGLDYIRTGPSYRNPVAFRGEQNWFRPWQDTTNNNPRPAPMLFAGFDLGLNWLHYTQYTGKTMFKRDKDRYFHTHQVQADLPMNSEFTLFETIMYGTTVEPAGSNPNKNADSAGRSMEWIYAMPFIPYYFASHYVGDRDNGALGMSGVFRGIPRWDLYFELMLDDGKSPLSMLDDTWWGNKWAMSSGWRWHFKQGPWHGEWRFEWTRIEPWVYTHHQGASHQYTHYGQNLGSDLGPNSQEFYTHYLIALDGIELKASVSAVSKDTAFGSHVSDIHTPSDVTTKSFLASKTTYSYQELGGEVRFIPRDWLWIRLAGYQYLGDYKGLRTEGSIGVTW